MPGALSLFGHQAGFPQQAQMPGYRGAADGHRRGDVPDRLIALAEQAQDVAPVRVTESVKRVGASWAGGQMLLGHCHRPSLVTYRLP